MGKYLDYNGVKYLWQKIFSRLLPSGGSAGQVLSKSSATDYDVAWTTSSGGGLSVTTQTIELPGTGWSPSSGAGTITVNVTGATASNDIIVAPDPSSDSRYNYYLTYGVRCIGQGAGTLTFRRDSDWPDTRTCNVNVMIIG